MRNYSSLLAILLLFAGSVKAQMPATAPANHNPRLTLSADDLVGHATMHRDSCGIYVLDANRNHIYLPAPPRIDSVRILYADSLHVTTYAKVVILTYHDGPVPLQVKGWIVDKGLTRTFLYADKRTPVPSDIIYPNGWIIKNW